MKTEQKTGEQWYCTTSPTIGRRCSRAAWKQSKKSPKFPCWNVDERYSGYLFSTREDHDAAQTSANGPFD